MLTQEQIRTLNDARTILSQADAPHTWEGGRVTATCAAADWAIFQALNHMNGLQHISGDLLHNRETDRTRSLGRADEVNVIGDENGFELRISTDTGTYVVNIHAVAEEVLEEVKQIAEWLEEGGRARDERRHDAEQADAYDLRNPKHPHFHSVHADLYDSREGK